MRSKSVLDRQKVAKAVIAAARVHAQEVGEELHTRFAPLLEEGETLPDFTQFPIHLARFLESRLEELLAAENRHCLELSDDRDARLRRDEAGAAVQQQILALREAVSAVYGSDRVPLVLGLKGQTAQAPFHLQRQAQQILSRLRQPVTVEPVSELLPADQLDLAGAAERLEEATRELDEAIREVERENCEAELTLRQRDEAMEAFDQALRGVGLIVKSFFSLAGFPEYAKKLHLTVPNRRSKGRRHTRRRSGQQSGPSSSSSSTSSSSGKEC